MRATISFAVSISGGKLWIDDDLRRAEFPRCGNVLGNLLEGPVKSIRSFSIGAL